jgi:carboxylate-amine ligase
VTAELTLGAEEEFHLIDLDSRQLSARAPQLLSRLPSENFAAEIQRTTVESNTDVVDSLDGLRSELLRLRASLTSAAAVDGLGPAAVGTAPKSDFADFELTPTGRYGRMQDQYRLLVDEQLICGLQIHVGVSDRDAAVRIMQRLSPDLPVLLALSASSPYWSEHDTGYASIRTIIWQRWPSAGATGFLESAAQYDELLGDLIASGVIADAKMAYFDVRPSSHAPTLELRVCDGTPLVDDAVLIAGLFRAMVRAAEIADAAGEPLVPRRAPVHRAAMWQAARGGLSGRLLGDSAHPRPVQATTAVRHLIRRLRPQLEELGDFEQVRELAEATLARGNSADRQRAAYSERGNLDDVVDLVLAETAGPASGPAPRVPALRSYRARAGDEAVSMGSAPRPVYSDILEHVRAVAPERSPGIESMRRSWAVERGLTFVVDGEERGFDVDVVPRILQRHEWEELRAGLTQRARAIEAFLRDVYGEGRIIREGVVSADEVRSTPGWREEARRLPADALRAPVMGFDLVRNEFGGWRVLEDNVRDPSGAAYAIAARDFMDAAMPDLPRPPGLLDPRASLPLVRSAIAATAAPGDLALLSSGRGTPAWFEHLELATRLDLRLVTPDDVRVENGRVVSDDGPIGALYLRIDGELLDLENDSGEPIGAAILDVAAAGAVGLANTPGNGVADDKAMYCHVPDLINFYLGERPLLEQVPTYRTSNPTERLSVLDRVGELVTKPVDGHGGLGVLIGPSAPAAEVALRRLEIAADPDGWVGQEVVTLSSHPTLVGSRLEPRHVDLRAFVYLTGPDDAHLADLALTRVAPEGSMIVNSTRGGGAKDTWILATDAAPLRATSAPQAELEEGEADVRTGR